MERNEGAVGSGTAWERAAHAARQWPRPERPTFVAAGSYAARRRQDAAPHRYAVWKLTYYRSGQIDALVDETKYRVTAGTILAIPPHADHAEIAHTDYANLYVLVNALPDWPWPDLIVDDGAQPLGSTFAALVREMASDDDHSAAMIDALVTQLDIALRRAATAEAGSPARAVVNAVDRLIEERHADSPRVSDLAREVGVSPSALRAYFVAELGMSPQARLLDVRLRHALALLQASNLTLASIAERCGYHSASHLSRHVRSVCGCSPGEVRRRATAGA